MKANDNNLSAELQEFKHYLEANLENEKELARGELCEVLTLIISALIGYSMKAKPEESFDDFVRYVMEIGDQHAARWGQHWPKPGSDVYAKYKTALRQDSKDLGSDYVEHIDKCNALKSQSEKLRLWIDDFQRRQSYLKNNNGASQ